MDARLPRWILLSAILAVAWGLRTHDLALRPMHADEANQAVKAGGLLDTGHYRYDPTDHHGPTLYYLTVPVAWLRGEHTLARLSETTVRLVPAIAGTATVILTFLVALPLGWWPALAAALLVAVSPAAVYYSRYYVHETLLGTFVLAAIVAARRWWLDGALHWALTTGAMVGLALATKASAPVFLAVTLLAAWSVRPARCAAPRPLGAILLGAGAAIVVAALFFSSFGANLPGLSDALRAYGAGSAKLGGAGHEKPWSYFLALLTWRSEGGLVFQQVGFLALAASGALLAWRRGAPPLLRAAAIVAAGWLIVLSLPAYKTPWHILHLTPPLALLAAGTLAFFGGSWRGRAGAALLTAMVVYLQIEQVRLTAFLRAADERNPYAYVHSSPDVLKVRTLALAATTRAPGELIRVISEEVWPFPWYLRDVPNVGYWTTVPPDCDGALVIASAGLADSVQARLHGHYRTDFLGLRPGFVTVVFTPAP